MIIEWTQGAYAQAPAYLPARMWTWVTGDGGEVADTSVTPPDGRVVTISASDRVVTIAAGNRTVTVQ